MLTRHRPYCESYLSRIRLHDSRTAVREDGLPDAGCCAPAKLRPDRGVSDAHCAASPDQRAIERCAITDVHIDAPQSRGRICYVGDVRQVEDAGRIRCHSVSDCRRDNRVLDWPRFDEQAGE
jgi:hypothetical protein